VAGRELKVVGPDDAGEAGDAADFTVAVDAEGHPTTVTAADVAGGRRHLEKAVAIEAQAEDRPVTITIYGSELCHVLEVDGVIGVVPAGTDLFQRLQDDATQVSRYLALDDIRYDARASARLRRILCRACGTVNRVVAWTPPMQCAKTPPPSHHDILR
jgi:hypothetical protein